MQLPAIHIIDFEGHSKYGVIEYGVVTIDAGGICSTKTRLCGPIGLIPSADIQVHGIEQDKVMGLPLFAEDYDYFVQLRRTGLFCAHNAAYEHNLMKSTWAFPPFAPSWRVEEEQIADWAPWLDTLALARKLRPGAYSNSLEALSYGTEMRGEIDLLAARYCPKDRCRAHCALYDCLATAVWLMEQMDWSGLEAYWNGLQGVVKGNDQGELFD